MKKVRVLMPFRDKNAFNTAYVPGEMREFDDDRAAALAALGLVEALEPATVAQEAKAEVAEAAAPEAGQQPAPDIFSAAARETAEPQAEAEPEPAPAKEAREPKAKSKKR